MVSPAEILDLGTESLHGMDAIDKELRFLETAAGLEPPALGPSPTPAAQAGLAGVTEAIKALAQDVSQQLGALGRLHLLHIIQNSWHPLCGLSHSVII